MIQSMTGYGKCVVEYNGKKIHAEVKSLNSKALDITARIAPIYREKEMEMRQIMQQKLERGKVDFVLWIEKDEASSANPLNIALVRSYKQQIEQMQQELALPEPEDWYSTLLRLPDVFTHTEVEELSDEEWAVARQAVEGAVDELEQNIGVDYDKNRLEQEMIYYIEKLDISEEKQRLTNHLRYFIETMQDGHGQGKKLGFIAQEMGREINTTGSKSNQAEMQNIVVKMKDELEQIKEQVLNVM